jgi:flavorubredoxin
VVELAAERLYLLPQILALDGRLSSHPLSARGFAPLNCFLVSEPGHALLIDTGFSAYEEVLLGQLKSLVGPAEPLSVWALRLGEYASICNVRPVVEHFAVDVLYGSQGVPPEWVDFRPEHVPYGSPVAVGALGQIDHRLARQGDAIAVGSGGRLLHTLVAPLRLLPTNWVYDEATRTLFTADAFTYVWQPTAQGPWVVSDDDDPTTFDGALEFLLGSRFWWLAGARTEPLRRGIDEVFETYPIETIAPSFGCVLTGRRTVERHHRLLDEILARAASMPSIGQDIASWRTGAAA